MGLHIICTNGLLAKIIPMVICKLSNFDTFAKKGDSVVVTFFTFSGIGVMSRICFADGTLTIELSLKLFFVASRNNGRIGTEMLLLYFVDNCHFTNNRHQCIIKKYGRSNNP